MSVMQKLSGLLYTVGIHIYQGGLKIASRRIPKARQMLEGRKETASVLRQLPAEGRRLWLHAASLGEFEQGRPLLERLRREHPGTLIVLSFYSPSGYEVRKNWQGADAVVYLPADTPRKCREFLDLLRPDMAVFVKYEFWGNFLHELRRRDVPVYLISGIFRSGQIFFKPWGGYWRSMLRCFTRLYVQDEGSARLLTGCGIEKVSVAGDTRFDRVTDIMRTTRELPLLDRFTAGKTRLTLIFGSSWPADEDVCLPWLKHHAGEMRIIIAPHEFNPERLDRLKTALRPELKTVLLSEAEKNPAMLDDADCLVMDCFGLLSSAYRYAHVAYVGGGFGAGLHNINEAAVYGIPVVYGPNNAKFIEARELAEAGGGFPVDGSAAYGAAMDSLLNPGIRQKAGAAAGAYIKSRLGATQKIYAELFQNEN